MLRTVRMPILFGAQRAVSLAVGRSRECLCSSRRSRLRTKYPDCGQCQSAPPPRSPVTTTGTTLYQTIDARVIRAFATDQPQASVDAKGKTEWPC